MEQVPDVRTGGNSELSPPPLGRAGEELTEEGVRVYLYGDGKSS